MKSKRKKCISEDKAKLNRVSEIDTLDKTDMDKRKLNICKPRHDRHR